MKLSPVAAVAVLLADNGISAAGLNLDYRTDQCNEYCFEFFKTCPNTNYYETDTGGAWSGVSSGPAPNQNGYEACMERCFEWPRTKSKDWLHPKHLMGDTYECRRFHLWEARLEDEVFNAAFHCFHSVEDGGNICSDIEVDGKTPFRHMRDGEGSMRHYGYCDLFGHDTVADCSYASLDDERLPYAMQMLPDTVQYLFLNDNEGITKLPADAFQNLKSKGSLKALYLDNCNITTVESDTFLEMQELEVLSLAFSFIDNIPTGMLRLPKLRLFNINGDPTPFNTKPGLLNSTKSYNDTLFQDTPDIERIQMYGHRGITNVQPGLLKGLVKLDTLFFVFCGLTNEGMPPEAFQDLTAMKYFDFQGNYFDRMDPAWFGDWVGNMVRLVFFMSEIQEPITDVNIFNGMPKLKWVYLDRNPGIRTLPDGIFDNNPIMHKNGTLTLY